MKLGLELNLTASCFELIGSFDSINGSKNKWVRQGLVLRGFLSELTSSETIIRTVFLFRPSNARLNLLVKLSIAKS